MHSINRRLFGHPVENGIEQIHSPTLVLLQFSHLSSGSALQVEVNDPTGSFCGYNYKNAGGTKMRQATTRGITMDGWLVMEKFLGVIVVIVGYIRSSKP